MAKGRQEVVNPYRPHERARGSDKVCGMSPGILLLAALLLLILGVRFHEATVGGRIIPHSFAEGPTRHSYGRRHHRPVSDGEHQKRLRAIEQKAAVAEEKAEKERAHMLQKQSEEVDLQHKDDNIQRKALKKESRRAAAKLKETWGLESESVAPQTKHAAPAAHHETHKSGRADAHALTNALTTFYQEIDHKKSHGEIEAIVSEWSNNPKKLHSALKARYHRSPFVLEDVLA